MMTLGVDAETETWGLMGYTLAPPPLAKAREASISTSRSKSDKVSRIVLPSCWFSTVSTLMLERLDFGEGSGLIDRCFDCGLECGCVDVNFGEIELEEGHIAVNAGEVGEVDTW
jgi:hypothetical protein